jgi:hypothetical protein
MKKSKGSSGYLVWVMLLFFAAYPLVVFAEKESPQSNDPAMDDILSGFEDMQTVEPETTEPEEETSWWALDGFLRFDASYNYSHDAPAEGDPDFRGLSKARATLRLELPLNLRNNWKAFFSGHAFYDASYPMKNNDDFSGELLDLYEREAELREAYVLVSPSSNLDIKIGRQIIAWGFADYTRVVDVLNPLDNREPGLVDIEDLRLPLAMSRIDYSFNNWRLTGFAIHETDFKKNPVYNSDFYSLTPPLPDDVLPSNNIKNTEFGVALVGNFRGWDLAFHWAEIFNDSAHFETVDQSTDLYHSPLTMVGATVNAVFGSWLWKAETAVFKGLKFFNLPGETRSRLDAMLGLEYSGITDTTLVVEIVNRHLFDFDPVMEMALDSANKNLTQYIAAYRADFLRERLNITAVVSFLRSEIDLGSSQRLTAGYDLFDAFTISGGILIFNGGKGVSVLNNYRDNDRIFLEAKYSF